MTDTHDHDHDHDEEIASPVVRGIPVDPEETARLKAEATEAGATPVGYFLGRAVDAETTYKRAYWMRRVDGARALEKRQEALEYLDQRARENVEADARLQGTEAELEVARVVGDAVILVLLPGEKSPGKYTLVSRLQGETGLTGHGADIGGRWVVRGLRQDAVNEFAVVSEDVKTGKELTGPWVGVPVGNVTLEAVNKAEEAEARRASEEAAAAEAEKQRQHEELAAQRRAAHQEQIKAQEAEAARVREQMARDLKERMIAHQKALERLPMAAPRHIQYHLRDQGAAGMSLDISFMRGPVRAEIFQFQVNGTVLGYPPDGRYGGGKPTDHVYRRSVVVPRGQTTVVKVYAWTRHGTAGEAHEIHVPRQLTYESDEGMLECASVGGGENGRIGFAARTFRHWGVTQPAGRYAAAGTTGLLALYEAAPSNGSGVMWVVMAHEQKLQMVVLDGVEFFPEFLGHTPGAGYLYRAANEQWPSREDRKDGIPLEIVF